MKHLLLALALFALPGAALAQDSTPPTPASTLFPGVIDLPVIEGSRVPDDCQFPASLSASARHDLACVVMTRDSTSSLIAAAYVGELGERGWRRDAYIAGGLSAVRVDADNCRRVIGIYPQTYPPDTPTATNAVIWFALDRERHCETTPTPG